MRRALIAAAALIGAVAAPLSADALALQGFDGRTVQANFAGMTRVKLSIVQHGKRHSYKGVSLAALLASVGAPSGEKLKGPDLSDVVLVTAHDGYVVALALAETDPAMRKEKIIVADKMDGKALPASDGPYRLVVEGDLRPARSERMVEKIEVRRLAALR